MPIKVEFGGIGLTGDAQRDPSAVRRPESGSVRIGVIGDFRGRGTRGPVESGGAWQAVGASRSTATTSTRSWPGWASS